DFHKGCYVGQELTSRMKRRGQIKTRVLPLNHEGCLVAGAEILAGERRAGEVLAAVHGASLGLMRLDRIDGALSCDGKPVHLNLPQWLAPAAFAGSPAKAPN
ncbi:MAG: CAF17-like 4Fe-4S cluster assembly/insertion protein YgfZ, partial [Asticcacaulis sp.]